MEIKNANELKMMVEQYKKFEDERIEAEVTDIVAKLIEEKLIPLAQTGKVNAYVTCGEHRYAVMKKLQENGYKVDSYGQKELNIRWC